MEDLHIQVQANPTEVNLSLLVEESLGYVNSFRQNRGSLSIWFRPNNIPDDHNLRTDPENGKMYLLTRRHHNNYTAKLGHYRLILKKGIHFYEYTLGLHNPSSVNQFFGGNIVEDQWNHVMVTSRGYYVRRRRTRFSCT